MNNVNQNVVEYCDTVGETSNNFKISSVPDTQKLDQSPDYIIHLGAGRCSELEDYFDLNPNHLILVEAAPGLAEALKKRVDGRGNVDIINKAVCSKSGSTAFYRYNQPELNSRYKPDSKLVELFPGLKMVEEISVDTLDLPFLLESFSLDESGNSHLIIDLPGEEESVLQVLTESDLLNRFDQILLNSSREALYYQTESGGQVMKQLQKLGFDLVREIVSQDQCFVKWEMKRNLLKVKNLTLKKIISDAGEENKRLEKTLLESDAELNKLITANNEQKKLISSTQDTLTETSRENDSQKVIIQELETKLKRIILERDEKDKLAARFGSKFDEASKSLSEEKIQSRKYRSKIEENSSTIEELSVQATEKSNLLHKMKAELGTVILEKQEMESNLDEIRIRLSDSNYQLEGKKSKIDLLEKDLSAQQVQIQRQESEIKSLIIHRDKEIKSIEDQKNNFDQVNQALNEAKERAYDLSESEKQILGRKKDLQRERDTLLVRITELETVIEEQRNVVESKESEFITLDSRLNNALATATLSAKHLTLRDNDLRELQERYKEEVKTRFHLREMLEQAENRLNRAETLLGDLTKPSVKNDRGFPKEKAKNSRRLEKSRRKRIHVKHN